MWAEEGVWQHISGACMRNGAGSALLFDGSWPSRLTNAKPDLCATVNKSTAVETKCLGVVELSTKHDFQLQRNKGLPAQLIPFIRFCYCQEESELKSIDLNETGELTEADEPILMQIVQYLQNRLARCEPCTDEPAQYIREASEGL